jgi:hypothetical protein
MPMKAHRVLVLGLSLLFPAMAPEALADDRAPCFDAALQGQMLRDQHKLIEARAQFLVCAHPECPTGMHSDCAGWLDAVERSMPTVVLAATDGNGASIADVAVQIDGKPVVAGLDGTAMDVNPGIHKFRFERADGSTAERIVQVNEGEKSVQIAVVFEALPAPAPPLKRPSAQGPSAQRVLGLTAGVVGVAGVIEGAVFGLFTVSKIAEQKSDCAPSACTESGHALAVTDHSTATTDGAISTVSFIAGGALAVTGALLYFTAGGGSSKRPQTGLAVVPSAGPGGGSLFLRGEF